MGKYWLKIGVKALLIFGVGFILLSVVRRAKSSVESDHDVTIPLGAFGAYLPFKLSGTKLGTLRSLTIQRSSPKQISGFVVRTRLTDSIAFQQLRACHLSVSDATHLDERTTFFCIKSDSGYQGFGEVRVEYREDSFSTTLVLPLMLTDAAVAEFKRHEADSVAAPLADSLASQLREGVRAQARVLRDSIRAESLSIQAERIRQRVDSIRGRTALPPSGRAPRP